MKKLITLAGMAAVLSLASPVVPPAEPHQGNVRKSDCTHYDKKAKSRHRHTGRPYCPTYASAPFFSAFWMHH